MADYAFGSNPLYTIRVEATCGIFSPPPARAARGGEGRSAPPTMKPATDRDQTHIDVAQIGADDWATACRRSLAVARGVEAVTSENETSTSKFAIRFKLRDIDKITSWGEPGKRQLHWFGLTSGGYCIDTPAGRLFECGGAVDPDLGVPWCDYYVVRLFEDLCEIWPDVRDPIPVDIADRYFAWDAREGERFRDSDDMELYDKWYEASSWWHARERVSNYLRAAPRCHIWRIGSEFRLHWTAVAPWLPPRAEFSLPFDYAQQAMAEFVETFLAAMAERVNTIERNNWQPRDGVLDIQGLVAEHAKREAWAKAALSDVRKTDWDLVRRRLDQLGA
jgi:hypothetical protein